MWLAIIVLTIAANSDENHCNDPVAAEQWQQLTDKYPDDVDLGALVGYRRHLCDQVAAGRLSLTEATQRFEEARHRLMNIWDQENSRQQKLQDNQGSM